jgi:hypothetical protein
MNRVEPSPVVTRFPLPVSPGIVCQVVLYFTTFVPFFYSFLVALASEPLAVRLIERDIGRGKEARISVLSGALSWLAEVIIWLRLSGTR